MSARNNILQKLRAGLAGSTPRPDDFDESLVTEPWRYPPESRMARLRELMEAVRTEVHLTREADWPALLAELLGQRQCPNLLYAPGTPHGQQLQQAWADASGLPQLRAYNRPVEEWKQELFENISASVTGTLGAIASTGSLMLWPDRHEPRLMSLVPPIHVALLKASEIHDNLYDVMAVQNWKERMPTNALLVSGPSKTADIEQVLAYGAHGPKELITLILEDA